jgi:GR25 family glycosyltransferase involved in LPS biosynthesis
MFNKNNSFCISLESAKDRWNRMQSRFEYFGMDVTRWIASTPDKLTDTFSNTLNPYQKACAQSHLNVWKHIIENKLEYALILEDDACFDKTWLKKTTDFLKNLGSNWDMILLNASEPIKSLHKWETVTEQYLAGGYILSLQGAEKLVNGFKNCYYSSDWMTSRLQQCGLSYSYFPWLIIQEGFGTTIGSDFEADHKKVVRCLKEINYSFDNYI